MAKRELPSPELLRQLLSYDPTTGELRWLPRSSDNFALPSARHSWNAQNAGNRADKPDRSKQRQYGTRRIVLVLDHPYLAHRVAWAVYYGEWPNDQIDHINGDPGDNRLDNLRVVSVSENRKNMARQRGSKAIMPGVRRRADRKAERWLARIYVAGKAVSLGTFDTAAEAIAARKAAEKKYGFHPNHGRSGPDAVLDGPLEADLAICTENSRRLLEAHNEAVKP